MMRRKAVLISIPLTMALTAVCSLSGETGRDRWQEPERVLRVLEIRKGARVADLGAGYGYFTFRLNKRVGPAGRVFAIDVSKPRLKHLRQKASRENRKQRNAPVQVVRGTETGSGLPDKSVDLILTVNTYHHLENRVRYFRGLKKQLRKGGRLAIIDYRPKDERYSGHSMARKIIVREMAAAGYQLKREFKFLEKQNFLIYAPR